MIHAAVFAWRDLGFAFLVFGRELIQTQIDISYEAWMWAFCVTFLVAGIVSAVSLKRFQTEG